MRIIRSNYINGLSFLLRMTLTRRVIIHIHKLIYPILIDSNQKKLVTKLNSFEGVVRLHSRPLSGGNIDNYFHFIFDLILPLNSIINEIPKSVRFTISSDSRFLEAFQQIFGDKAVKDPEETSALLTEELIGMNPIRYKVKKIQFTNLFSRIKSNLAIKPMSPKKILLIERKSATKSSQRPSEIKTGKELRSIVNHHMLKLSLQENLSSSYEFLNLNLDETTFQEQVRLFNSAGLVIAQHGAGMTNLIWMQPKAVVVELGFKNRNHFRIISETLNLNYIAYNFSKRHIRVDTAMFIKELKENSFTKLFFNP